MRQNLFVIVVCQYCEHQIILYHPTRPYAGLINVLVIGLACRMLVCGSNLNVCTKPEKLEAAQDTIGV
jgi:hypothetical protein